MQRAEMSVLLYNTLMLLYQYLLLEAAIIIEVSLMNIGSHYLPFRTHAVTRLTVHQAA